MTLETKIAKQISKLAGFDILRKTRQRDVIEARSLMFHILVKYHGVRPYAISRKIKVGGAPLNHATILHSLKSFDTYRRYNKNLDKWLDARSRHAVFIKPKNINNTEENHTEKVQCLR